MKCLRSREGIATAVEYDVKRNIKRGQGASNCFAWGSKLSATQTPGWALCGGRHRKNRPITFSTQIYVCKHQCTQPNSALENKKNTNLPIQVHCHKCEHRRIPIHYCTQTSTHERTHARTHALIHELRRRGTDQRQLGQIVQEVSGSDNNL